uniref:TLC domain-containing protein n=2 Tax=Timema TaxID=61471 RepID=A0A7R9IMP3_9NEOP|nr:unnamed protein product [Timema bartmani]CAD7461066.1 unnamed protein product [Timema tahoe]
MRERPQKPLQVKKSFEELLKAPSPDQEAVTIQLLNSLISMVFDLSTQVKDLSNDNAVLKSQISELLAFRTLLGHSLRQQALMMVLRLCHIVKTIQRIPLRLRVRPLHARKLLTGYFVYDLMDMMINHRKRSSYELMVHHVVVIICFGLSVMTRYYLGYGLMALLVEVNSIFLHIRQLMLVQSLRKSHILYRLNSLLTIGTFIVFRITTLGWMTRWLVLHRDELSVTAFTIGSASMPVIMVMNIVLFLRILNSDYRQRQPTNNDGFLNTLHQEELLCNQDKTD